MASGGEPRKQIGKAENRFTVLLRHEFDLRLTAGEGKLQGCIESCKMKRVASDAWASLLLRLKNAFALVVFSLVFLTGDWGTRFQTCVASFAQGLRA